MPETVKKTRITQTERTRQDNEKGNEEDGSDEDHYPDPTADRNMAHPYPTVVIANSSTR